MKGSVYITLLLIFSSHTGIAQVSQANSRLVGGPCEGCEAIFELNAESLSDTVTLPGYANNEPRIRISGTVFMPDGKTPASGVILYLYQTNREGIYPPSDDGTVWGSRHGAIRGWVRTSDSGKYTFFTFRPGSYPAGTEPAHIHLIILEPDGKYYWLESYQFEDDPLLTSSDISDKPRGGYDGVMELELIDGIYSGQRDIILGRNISGYK